MRLERVRTGHRFKHKLLLKVIKVLSKHEPPDVVKTILYRPEFFGIQFSKMCQNGLRGDSEWTVSERELFAAFVSKMNQCVF